MKKVLVLSTMIALLSGLTTLAAVTIQENTVWPDQDIITGQSQQAEDGFQIMRNENTLHIGTGQSFTLSGAETLEAITIQMGVTKDKTMNTNATHEFELWIGTYDDTTVSNHVAGTTNLLTSIDVAGLTFTDGNYYTLNLDAPLALAAGDYAFQLYWTTADQGDHRIWWARNSTGGYSDGESLVQDNLPATGGLPFEEVRTLDDHDLVFALHSSTVGSQTTLSVDPESLSISHDATDGSTTGSVDFAYTGAAVNITNITIGSESHPGSFSHLASLPVNLTDPDPTNYPVEFVFSNVSNLSHLGMATAVATIDWEVDGGGGSGQVVVSLSATVADKIYGRLITLDDFPQFNPTAYTNTVGSSVQRMRATGANTTSAGQAFAIDTTTKISRVSVYNHSKKSGFTNGTHEIKLWIGEYENDTPGAAYAIELFDVTNQTFEATSYIMFDLTKEVSLPPGDYAFQFAWTTTNAAHDLIWRRTESGSDYAAGARLNSVSADLPFAATTTVGSGIRFTLHSHTDATWSDAGTSFPTDGDIIASLDATTASNKTTLVRNVSGSKIRATGQSFDLAAETTLSAITIQTSTDETFNSAKKHELDLWIVSLDDGLSNNVPLWVDAVSLSSETMMSNNFYKIDFTDITVPAGSYGIEIEWALENSNHQLNWRISDGVVDEYADGYLLNDIGYGLTAPYDGSVSSADLVFALHGTVNAGFSVWIASYGLTGDDLLPGTDVEPDGLDNLMEYGIGGNPTNDDAAAVSPATYTAEDGGTNWFYHVYDKRVDDAALTFTLGATENLALTAADTNDVEFVGQSAESGGFRTQTNRTEATPDAKFIKLEVQKD